jgi:hypothetical protein
VGTWNDAVALALTLGADVDQHCARGDGVACLVWVKSSQSVARRVEHFMDRRAWRIAWTRATPRAGRGVGPRAR